MRGDRALAARNRWLVRETPHEGQDAAVGTTEPRAPAGASRPTGQRAPAASRALVPLRPDGTLVVEPLTAKELEVLVHLGELLTTEEIAQTMFISVNTVRTHVRNVLRKLAVSRRHEAVRKARSLQLIPG
ncbi:response regulator transcription factor [Georgenia sp. SUBG003]|uniref:response regulator transcription factor n=1 Tax=Georgenia sp. SUBG003 TaxID=1497974 RepID=UPI003AB50A57